MAFKVKLPTMFLGAVYDHVFNYWSKSGDTLVAVDLTGYEAAMDIRANGVLIGHLSTGNGRIQLVGNQIKFSVHADVTGVWSFTEGEYDFLLYPAGSPSLAKLALFGAIPGKKVRTVIT